MKIEKLIARFLTFPSDFTFRELKKLLKHFGFELYNKGITSGSRIIFVDSKGRDIKLHRPHGSVVDLGALHYVHKRLQEFKLI
jgi:hypothetical protein